MYARRIVTEHAAKMGFSEIEQAEIEIIVSELGTNIIKHAGLRGEISASQFRDTQTIGLEIIAYNGPPRSLNNNIKEWIKGGQYTGSSDSTTGTLGIGLSAVGRLSDYFNVKIDQDGSFTVCVRKLIGRPAKNVMKTSVLTKPKSGETSNGDAYFIKQNSQYFFFCLVDVLGHGPGSEPVARKCIRIVENCYYLNLAGILNECDNGLKGTRGAAVCLGKVNYNEKMMEYISLGNIETIIYNGKTCHLISYDGTVGRTVGQLNVRQYPFKNGDLLIAHTDGVSNSFKLENEMLKMPVQQIASVIFNRYAREYDDATILVAK